jgi:hypothetical protein
VSCAASADMVTSRLWQTLHPPSWSIASPASLPTRHGLLISGERSPSARDRAVARIGYDTAAATVKATHANGITLREAARRGW